MKKIERKKAVALSYDEAVDVAPKLIAKGEGRIAEEIIQKAKEQEIPIHEDRSLVELLSKININETIPESLFLAVAEVFAFIYSIDQQLKSKD